jgi:hypothetical protein
MGWNPGTPNPGSDKAVRQGCTCPRKDNGDGKRSTRSGRWWINLNCELHSK